MIRPVLTLVVTAALAGCSGGTGASAVSVAPAGSVPAAYSSEAPYSPSIDPGSFTATVDNPYFPLAPGSRWVYQGSGAADGQVDTVTVLDETRTVMGIECVVVRDEVSEGGELVELTDDWYAQDADGNVWYMGEASAEYANGEVSSTAGSWEAGVDGAGPGIIMLADPIVGTTYRQEFYAGEAEDVGKVVETGQAREVPAGSYTDVLVTEDWSLLEAGARERKSYAPGVGLVAEDPVEGTGDTFELVEFTAGT